MSGQIKRDRHSDGSSPAAINRKLPSEPCQGDSVVVQLGLRIPFPDRHQLVLEHGAMG